MNPGDAERFESRSNSRRVPFVVLALVVLGAILLALPAWSGEDWVQQWAQVQDKEAELRRLAALPEDQQALPANQALLKGWYLSQIYKYGVNLRGSALYQSRTIWLDSPSLHRILGACPVFWRPSAGTAGFVPYGLLDGYADGGAIQFPAGRVSMDAGSYNTCWHESQHVLLKNVPLSANYLDWLHPYMDPLGPNDDARDRLEHAYIEGLGHRGVEWLDRLFAHGFENEAKREGQRLELLKRSREPITWEVENGVWAKTHRLWKISWPLARMLAPMPDNLREEYQRATNVTIPTVEQVITFYMHGGLKTTVEGQEVGVQVPRWVFSAGDVYMPVIIEDQLCNMMPVVHLVKDSLQTAIDFQVREQTADIRVRPPPLLSGRLVVSLNDCDDDNAELKLFLGNQEIPGTPIADGPRKGRTDRWFEIPDLSVHKQALAKPTPFTLRFARNKAHTLNALSKAVTYRIAVDYTPQRKPNEPPLYEATRAVYLITVDPKDITGLPKTPPRDPAPASNTTGKSSDPATGKTTTHLMRLGPEVEAEYGALPEGWEIGKPEEFGNKSGKPLLIFFKELKRFGGLYGYVEAKQYAPDQLSNFKTAEEHARYFTNRDKEAGWTYKAKETRIGDLPAFEALVGNFEAGSGLRAIFWLHPADKVEIAVFAQDSPGSCNPKNKAEYEQAHTQIKREAYALAKSLIFHLPLSGKITKEAPAAKPLDPLFKNEPPKPGEVIARRPPTEAEKTELASLQEVPAKDSAKKASTVPPANNTPDRKGTDNGSTYSPPNKEYSLALPAGWSSVARKPGDSEGLISAPGGSFTLACPDAGRELPADFKEFSARLAETLRRQHPAAKVSSARGLVVAQIGDGGKPMWLIFAGAGRRACCFTVLAQDATATVLPTDLTDALRNLRWRGAGTGGSTP